jgi:predicted amidohydrolase
MRALLAQLVPEPAAPEANARRAAELLSEHDVELAVFPELYLSGYDLALAADAAIDSDSAPIATLRSAAADTATAVAVGFVERRGSAIANAAALIDDHGELVAVYRKTQLFGAEASVFAPGTELMVAELCGRRVGTLICFEMEFPEPARALARAGADLLVTVSANMEPFYADHELASRARALDNRLPHLYVNRSGEEAGLRFVGGTRAVAADGTVTHQAKGEGEELLSVEVGAPGSDDDRVDYLAHVPEDLPVIAPTTARGGRP